MFLLRLFGKLALITASYASIFGLYFTLLPLSSERSTGHWIVLGIGTAAALLLIVCEAIEHFRTAPKRFRDNKKINHYMRNWVSRNGRAVIFSRDLSWANDDKTKSILVNKAERDELIICLSKATQLSNELKQRGAKIVEYGTDFVPKGRFTIVDYEKDGARVAIGLKRGDVHTIEEFRSGSHPMFAVAEDLARYVIRSAET